ncbi:MAG TPA: hypothetical protein VMW72_13205 [Sedimentisphaerales bacterium]|nr:hypothetical protein [Sedimentisphaerales bacterium]
MVKKILFTIAVVAFLTASVQAVDPGKNMQKFDGMWPYEYIYVPVCSIPILMDVGYYVQLEKCADYKIKLKQVPCNDGLDPYPKSATEDFPCYRDCEEIKVRANFDAKLGGKVENKVSWWGADKEKVYYEAAEGLNPSVVPGNGQWHTRKVCIKAWDIQIWDAGAQGDEIHVADLWITVKPDQSYASWEGTWQGGGPTAPQ